MLSAIKIPGIMFAQMDACCEKNETAPAAVSYEHFLRDAAAAIGSTDYGAARNLLRRYMAYDMENPEAYNLLGISYEMEGDRLKAARFYRVSYYMDQTFSAPVENLNRVSMLWYKGNQNISWGMERIGDNL